MWSVSRAFLSRPPSSPPRTTHSSPRRGVRAPTSSCSTRSGRCCSLSRSPGISASRCCWSRRRPRPRRCLSVSVENARARGRLEISDPHLAGARGRAARDRDPRRRRTGRARRPFLAGALDLRAGAQPALVAFMLLLAGLAAKIGWAPVHNWLPDAHSEAPAPVSALLSAALLPTVLLVAWRSEHALAPVIGPRTVETVLIAFGLVSLAGCGAVPLAGAGLEAAARLLEPRAHGSDRARHRLRHAARPDRRRVHIAGHAIAKALGFYAATPLLGHERRASGHAVTGIARTEPTLGTAMGISLGTLAGVPPSPLFVSEMLILAGASKPAGPGRRPPRRFCSHSGSSA